MFYAPSFGSFISSKLLKQLRIQPLRLWVGKVVPLLTMIATGASYQLWIG
jgi:hypothetical protein